MKSGNLTKNVLLNTSLLKKFSIVTHYISLSLKRVQIIWNRIFFLNQSKNFLIDFVLGL